MFAGVKRGVDSVVDEESCGGFAGIGEARGLAKLTLFVEHGLR